jgi:glucan biosynthesis protein C
LSEIVGGPFGQNGSPGRGQLPDVQSTARCGRWSPHLRNSCSYEKVDSADRPFRAFAAPSRLPGLDALRALAMLLGVVLHACVPYSGSTLSGLIWPVHNSETSPLCEALFWTIHAFRLPLFFFLAGFFSQKLMDRQDLTSFYRQRAMRILVPYYVGLVTILPLNLVVWNWGWVLTGRSTWTQALSPFESFEGDLQHHYFGPAHLWFLMDLSILTLGWVGLRWSWPASRQSAPPWHMPLGSTIWRPAVFALVSNVCLWDELSLFTGHHNSFVPHVVRLAYYGFYFLMGVELCRRPVALKSLVSRPGVKFACALPALATVVLLAPRGARGELSGLSALPLSAAVAWSAWFILAAALGWGLRWRHDPPAVRYVADASYWIYLIHLPLVGLGQVALHAQPWPPAFKMLLVTAGATVGGLVTYQLAVRNTFIGRVLHGPRDGSPRPGPRPAKFPGEAIPAPHVAAVPTHRRARREVPPRG